MRPPPTNSPLLALPRELRDQILYYVLYYGPIPIESALVEAYDFPGFLKQRRCENNENLDTLTKTLYAPWRSRKTWDIQLEDTFFSDVRSELCESIRLLERLKRIPEIEETRWEEKLRVTYQLARLCSERKYWCVHHQELQRPVNYYGNHDLELELNIMLVCTQLYTEACKIFYSSNTFSFMGDFPIPTLLAFLQDRTATSRSQILSLDISPYLQTRFDRNNPPVFNSSHICGRSDSQRPASIILNRACSSFAPLCALLSTPQIHLRRVNLVLRNICRKSIHGADEAALEEHLRREEEFPVETPKWMASLAGLKSLEKVSMTNLGNGVYIKPMGDLLGWLSGGGREGVHERRSMAPMVSMKFAIYSDRFRASMDQREYKKLTVILRYNLHSRAIEEWQPCKLRFDRGFGLGMVGAENIGIFEGANELADKMDSSDYCKGMPEVFQEAGRIIDDLDYRNKKLEQLGEGDRNFDNLEAIKKANVYYKDYSKMWGHREEIRVLRDAKTFMKLQKHFPLVVLHWEWEKEGIRKRKEDRDGYIATRSHGPGKSCRPKRF